MCYERILKNVSADLASGNTTPERPLSPAKLLGRRNPVESPGSIPLRRGFIRCACLIELNALAAGAVGRSLMKFSAMAACPNGGNGKGKTVFTIAEVGVHSLLTFARCVHSTI